MSPETREKALRAVLVATGLFLVFLLPFMFDLWPRGFRWGHPGGHAPYERMIVAIYFSLGICLLLAARDPSQHTSLIDFTILSSFLHGAVMTYDAFAQEGEMTHMVGDVPLIFAVAAILFVLRPRKDASLGHRSSRAAASGEQRTGSE